MRIGIDARELSSRPTGVGRYLAELLARWTRWSGAAGHVVVLFSPRALPREAGWRGTGGAALQETVVAGAGGSRWEQGALARALRRDPVDLFFAPGYTAPLLMRAPIVVAMHDVSFAAHPEWFRWREGLRLRLVAGYTARRAGRVVTLTRFSRDEIVTHLGVPVSKVEVIAPAADTHPALSEKRGPGDSGRTSTSAGREPLILYVGSMFTRRHIPELLEAFDRLGRPRADLRLALVGQDRTWPPERLAERIASSRVAGQIEWYPWIDDGALRALFSRARAFAFLSEYEGFGLTPLEALAAGVPPVVADVPVAHEAYGNGALYVDPRDPAAVAEALRRALDDDATRERLLASAPALVARHSWDDAARRTFDVLLHVGRPAA